jgi:DNA-binding GntR family transcriptional regulator
MAQRVADALAAKILDGTYKLGERLIEADLIKQLDVSNSVVREAFLILQGQGIVVADPYRGRRVFDIATKR